MRTLRKFLRVIDRINEWTGKVVSFLIVLIIGTIIWYVMLRYLFGRNTAWDWFAAARFLSIYVALGGGYALLYRAHVNTDILQRYLSPRARGIVDMVTSTLFFLFCIILLWRAIPDAVSTASRLNFSLWLFYPLNWPTKLLAAVGILLLLLQGLAKFIRDLITAVTGREIV